MTTLAMLAIPTLASAQEPGLKLAVGDVGLGLGDVPRLDGLRVNFRDGALERVRGVNLTVWQPHDGSRGVVQGLALGIPVTGGWDVSGLALGAGVSAERDFQGIGAGLLGIGFGEEGRGILVGGLGVGGGGSLSGIAVGGLGVGSGASVNGVAVGGLGVGSGEGIRGIAVGGLGAGAGGPVEGIVVGGLGVGAGDDLTGVAVGGLGVGVGGDLSGLAIGGLGVGVGGGRGVAIAPAYFKVEEGGTFRGLSISAFNDVRGIQRGLSIGILNIADELHGVQIGLINIARNKESFGVMPLVNYNP